MNASGACLMILVWPQRKEGMLPKLVVMLCIVLIVSIYLSAFSPVVIRWTCVLTCCGYVRKNENIKLSVSSLTRDTVSKRKENVNVHRTWSIGY